MPLPYEVKAVGPITTPDEARNFIRLLGKHELTYHFDDDPASIVRIKDGERVFEDEDGPFMRDRVRELFAFEFDPFAFALALGWAGCMNHEWFDDDPTHKVCVKCGYDSQIAEEAWK